MGMRMKVKFDKYWGDIKKINVLIYFLVILDPREKLEVMEDVFIEMYGEHDGATLFKNVKKEMQELFEDYRKKLQPPPPIVVDSQVSGSQ
ncbi:hypothetical protein M5689_019020 [Euphorbia peplus]|nr:hypothetical protein M5689_019020 [Euphorbia peplus]